MWWIKHWYVLLPLILIFYLSLIFKRHTFSLTRDGFLNHFLMETGVVCQLLSKFDLFNGACFTYNPFQSIIFVKGRGNQILGFLEWGTKKKGPAIFIGQSTCRKLYEQCVWKIFMMSFCKLTYFTSQTTISTPFQKISI